MAYIAPDAAELKLRYPAFAAVADVTVEYWLSDADRFVDESWAESDYAPAIMAAAAHNMTIAGHGASTGAGAIPAGVTRFKSGAMDVTVSEAAASAQSKGGWQSTTYGREYALLLRRNKGGPRVISAGTLPACGYPIW